MSLAPFLVMLLMKLAASLSWVSRPVRSLHSIGLRSALSGSVPDSWAKKQAMIDRIRAWRGKARSSGMLGTYWLVALGLLWLDLNRQFSRSPHAL